MSELAVALLLAALLTPPSASDAMGSRAAAAGRSAAVSTPAGAAPKAEDAVRPSQRKAKADGAARADVDRPAATPTPVASK